MVRRTLSVLALSLPLTGCLSAQLIDTTAADGVTPVVPSGPFAGFASPPGQVKANYAPASTETSLWVDRVGRDILAANPEIGFRPVFSTIVVTHPELFHQGTHIVYITEGLAKKCKGDAPLSALLCLELGKMVAEREALGPKADKADPQPPIEAAVGSAGARREVDLTALAERARYEQERKQAAQRRKAPDPSALAATYLQNAGFGKGELDAVAPLLTEAEKNYRIERQFNGAASGPAWRPSGQ